MWSCACSACFIIPSTCRRELWAAAVAHFTPNDSTARAQVATSALHLCTTKVEVLFDALLQQLRFCVKRIVLTLLHLNVCCRCCYVLSNVTQEGAQGAASGSSATSAPVTSTIVTTEHSAAAPALDVGNSTELAAASVVHAGDALISVSPLLAGNVSEVCSTQLMYKCH
jgi:hypothetical protein